MASSRVLAHRLRIVILAADAATCLTAHVKFLALGTEGGAVHVLDLGLAWLMQDRVDHRLDGSPVAKPTIRWAMALRCPPASPRSRAVDADWKPVWTKRVAHRRIADGF
jgi:hypothetical protein